MFRRKSKEKARWIQSLSDAHAMKLTRYATRLLGDVEKGREVVQETFLRLWKAEEAEVKGHEVEWLYTVCRNRAFDVRRKERRMAPLLDSESVEQVRDDSPLPSNVVELRETNSRILEALGSLTANQQEVVRLKFQSGLSYREIAAVTGLSESNIGFLIHTAVKELRARLGEETLVAGVGGDK